MVTDLEGRLRRIDYGDRVYFNSILGIAGTTYPIGTADMPSDVIADVIAICAARNLHAIDVHGILQLGAAMNHYCLLGHCHESITDVLDLNGQDVDDSRFDNCMITGAQGGAGLATYMRCILYNTSGIRGLLENCALYGTLAVATGNADWADFDHCTSVHGLTTVTIASPDRVSFKDFTGGLILTAQAAGAVLVRGIKGYLEVDAMGGGTLDIYADAADIQINGDCTVGTINIYGNARVVGAGGGVTINDYTINTKLAGQAPVEGTVTANWNTATGTSGEAGEDLVTIGVAATRYKLHSLLLDVNALTDGAVIDVKLFMKINGNERKVYDQAFTVPTTAAGETPPPDTLGLWIVNGMMVIHDTLRVEVYSDTNENVAIAYTYILEEM